MQLAGQKLMDIPFLIEFCGLVVLSTLQVTPVTCTEQKELGLTAYTRARETDTGYSESPY